MMKIEGIEEIEGVFVTNAAPRIADLASRVGRLARLLEEQRG